MLRIRWILLQLYLALTWRKASKVITTLSNDYCRWRANSGFEIQTENLSISLKVTMADFGEVGIGDFVLLEDITLDAFMRNLKIRYEKFCTIQSFIVRPFFLYPNTCPSQLLRRKTCVAGWKKYVNSGCNDRFIWF